MKTMVYTKYIPFFLIIIWQTPPLPETYMFPIPPPHSQTVPLLASRTDPAIPQARPR